MSINLRTSPEFVKFKIEESLPEVTCSFCKKPKSEVRVITGLG